MRQELEPLELALSQRLVRAAGAPVLVRVRPVALGREEARLHHVRDAVVERGRHVVRIRVVPGDDRVEPRVGLAPRPHGMQADAVAELAQPLERSDALARGEVVEDALGHEEVGRLGARIVLELCEPQGGVERQVDVVAEQEVPGGRLAVEEREAIAAGARRVEELPVMREIERAAHAASTSTSSNRAAASARSSASTLVSATAIT